MGQSKEITPQHGNPSKQEQQKTTFKAGQLVNCRADLLNLREAFKLELPYLAVRADQAASTEGRVKQLSVGEINISDHPA
jgi:hypothetical protein